MICGALAMSRVYFVGMRETSFLQMRAVGLRPNERTYSAAITACGNAGEWARALELLEHLRSMGEPINEARKQDSNPHRPFCLPSPPLRCAPLLLKGNRRF